MNRKTAGIRSAGPEELPAVVDACLDAFSGFTVFGPPWADDAGLLPARLCTLPDTLSRVAVDSGGRIIGHAQWTCFSMTVQGQGLPAACLAPLSVRRSHQGRGIGSRLLADGFRMLADRGIRLVILFGDPAFYTRSGMLPGCHGRHGLTVPLPEGLDTLPGGWNLRPPEPGDPQVLLRLWKTLCGPTDGAWEPGPGLLPWTSGVRGINACVLEHRGEVMAACRFDSRKHTGPGNGLLRFLARSPESAALLARRVVAWTGWHDERLWLPLPPDSPAVSALLTGLAGPDGDIQAAFEVWPHGLALDLAPHNKSPDISQWLQEIREGKSRPPFLEWPAIFDF